MISFAISEKSCNQFKVKTLVQQQEVLTLIC